jgi:hypothetical protein
MTPFEPLRLQKFDSDADPDPGFHSNADADLISPKIRIHADQDPQRCKTEYFLYSRTLTPLV